ncbi:MAG: helix-turn-helix domain-containing protein [Vicinamibacterales bacterium]
MLFLHRIPVPPLDTCVEQLWFCRQEPRPFGLERTLPTGSAQLILNLAEDEVRAYSAEDGRLTGTSAGSVVAGLGDTCQVIDTAEQTLVAGVIFRPGGTGAFMDAPAHEMRDRDVPLEALWSPAGVDRLRDQLLSAADPVAVLDVLERALLQAWRGRAPHRAVAFAVDAIGRGPAVASIADVTRAIGMSPRRFADRFEREVGITPKRFCRLRRFQRAVRRAHAARPVDWVAVAGDCGYFDQSHFIRDFRAFSGLTPSAYLAARTAHHNHVTFTP